jgi:hypothetical protein
VSTEATELEIPAVDTDKSLQTKEAVSKDKEKQVVRVEFSGHSEGVRKRIDTFGAQRVAFAKAKETYEKVSKPFEKLEKAFLEDVADPLLASNEETVLVGDEYDVEIGPKGNRTEITDKKLLIEKLGLDLFLKIATVSVEDMKRYLTDDELKECIANVRKTKRPTNASKLKKK